jgi:hypothetical protein
MHIAQVIACRGWNEISTQIYRDRPIESIEVELLKIQLQKLIGGQPAFLISYESDDEQIDDSPSRQD